MRRDNRFTSIVCSVVHFVSHSFALFTALGRNKVSSMRHRSKVNEKLSKVNIQIKNGSKTSLTNCSRAAITTIHQRVDDQRGSTTSKNSIRMRYTNPLRTRSSKIKNHNSKVSIKTLTRILMLFSYSIESRSDFGFRPFKLSLICGADIFMDGRMRWKVSDAVELIKFYIGHFFLSIMMIEIWKRTRRARVYEFRLLIFIFGFTSWMGFKRDSRKSEMESTQSSTL